MLSLISRLIRIALFVLAGAIGLYCAAAFLLPCFQVNGQAAKTTAPVNVFIVSNGVHTDVVMPAAGALKNWTSSFPPDHFEAGHSALSYIGFGWGDKGFYLDTPEWKDLKASTAFNAAFGRGSSLMHVRYLKEPKAQKGRCVEVPLDEKGFLNLVKYIEDSFAVNAGGYCSINHPGYGQHDHFYEARGTYSLFKTCNLWTNNALKAAGARVALWSPFAGPLLRSLEP